MVADVNAPAGDHGGRMTLHAASEGHVDVVLMLLAMGGDLNALASCYKGERRCRVQW